MPSASGTHRGAPARSRPAAGQEPADSADPVLDAERAHLRSARKFLRLMRENVLSLRALGGDPVSEEYLKADLYRRAEALYDLPDTPLFFGRLDYAAQATWPAAEAARGNAGQGRGSGRPARGEPGGSQAGRVEAGRAEAGRAEAGRAEFGSALPGEQFHIGRRHVHDPDGRPVVIDWRAPVSRPFYRASQGEPLGLARRRRFGFSGGQLTAYEDEGFDGTFEPARAGRAAPGQAPLSRIVIDEIERPRSGSMRDIVATIQPEQDDIVRASAAESVCVQGAPGTGKTAVGLHRVAYLLYAYRERMSRGGVLVIGPNRAFLTYIRNVLPALGEFDAEQTSVTELISAVPVRGADADETARLKGDARMAEVLRRALWNRLADPTEPILLARGSRRWRVHAERLGELVDELRVRGVRYGTGREMLSHRIAHVILSQMEVAGETCDDRTHEAVRRSSQVRKAVDAIWPKADPVRVVFALLSDPAAIARAADGVLSPAERAALAWPRPPRGLGSARWSAADAVLVDEVKDMIERTPSLAHIVVDEAQDLSAMACRAIGQIAPELAPATSVRQDPGSLVVTGVQEAAMAAALSAACADALARPGSIAVITADADAADAAAALAAAAVPHEILDGEHEGGQLVVVPVSLAKGLEFDHVIVVEPARVAAADARGLHRLYVALTRAVSRLTVLHAEPLPEPLSASAPPVGPGPGHAASGAGEGVDRRLMADGING